MIESGSMQLVGRRCGLLTLKIAGSIASYETQPMRAADDAIFDARYKLDECVASRSPVEAEIAFLNHWLSLAENSNPSVEVPPAVVNYPPLAVESPIFAAAYHSPDPPIKNDNVPIASVEFSTIDNLQDPDFNTTATRK